MKIKRIGIVCLAVWLILGGLLEFVSIPVLSGTIMAILAIVAGILILIDR